MAPSLRKFVGLLLLLGFLTLYIAAAIIFAPILVPEGAKQWEMVYYIVTGFLWVIPAGYIIAWMQRSPS